MTHSDLIAVAVRWLKAQGHTVVISDMGSAAPETPDAIGWKSGGSTLVECKASRADFFADSKKHFRRMPHSAMGRLRYYLCPPDLLAASEMPLNWGLLYARERGLSIIKTAPPCADTSRAQEIDVLCSAVRRLVTADGVRGVMCRVYRFDREGDHRAELHAESEAAGIEAAGKGES